MGKLYEINGELERLNSSMEWNPDMEAWVDVDTGEIVSNEEYEARVAALGLQKKEIMEWMGKSILNDRAEVEMLKAEIGRLRDKVQRHERREERFLWLLDRECAGKKTDLGVCTVNYRVSHPLVCDDEGALIRWLEKNGHDECLKYADPELRKSDVAKLIKSGVDVPGTRIGDKVNVSLK